VSKFDVTLTWEVGPIEAADPASAIMIATDKVRRGQTGATLNDAWAHRLPEEEEEADE
jgi:hypothetical protein